MLPRPAESRGATPECGLLIEGASPGAWNMAVDEVLLHLAAETQRAYLRFYRWSEPTLSLGYFQPYAQRRRHKSSQHCVVVRRTTGGGAIVHDRELTYSFAVPIASRFSAAARGLDRVFHMALVDVLASWNIRATLCRTMSKRSGQPEPFLCYHRRAIGDVLIGDAKFPDAKFAAPKFAGSAQRRHQGAVLQHGSVLLRTSSMAPELPGLEELTGVPIEVGQLIRRWTAVLSDRLGMSLEPISLAADVAGRAQVVADDKFGCRRWTHRR